MKKSDLILDILLRAIRKEIDAYNTYVKASESSPYPETKSLLAQLAEEERKHRNMLLHEYRTLRGMLQKSKPRKSYLTKDRVRYSLSAELPFKQLRTVPGIDVAAISLPTEFMGGDYLETFPLSSVDGQLTNMGIVLGDIMGHGLQASQLKGLIKSTFARLLDPSQPAGQSERAAKTASFIEHLNRILWEPCRKADSYIPLFYCVLDPDNENLVYTSAGHIPPILFTEHGSKYTPLANTQLVIGILQQVDYSKTEIQLRRGDLLMLYSDGVTEATDRKGEEFGMQRLVGLVQQHCHLASKAIIRQICQGLTGFLQDTLLQDELTIAIAKIA
ncbi:hypothetical protein CEE39_07560 [bacterium (candidate division B38) B3_B38]|nr:MAG: hypothetical protein CEE39_07560 [bacterium (candidate division B38) B3_B38]